MDIIVTYDVNTLTPEGRRRLRLVARICMGYGQRVQWSVFECTVSEAQMEKLRLKLLGAIDQRKDSLRIYRLLGGREGAVETYGRDGYVDFEDPLIV